MYGVAGERRLPEMRARDWLPGYEGSAPVRIGNAASSQFQLDVYGEVMDALHQAPRAPGCRRRGSAWRLQRASCSSSSRQRWQQPDEGIWEVRGPRRHFTHSKVMAWVAFDRGGQGGRARSAATGRSTRWRGLRDEIHARGLRRGLRHRARHLHAVLRLRRSWTRACS